MKHIKLFENFNRYDFGIYTDRGAIEEYFNELRKTHGNFTDNETKCIINIITEKGYKYDINLDFGRIYMMSKKTCHILISLGDYCYAMFYEVCNDYGTYYWISCEIIDDFDNLLLKIKEI